MKLIKRIFSMLRNQKGAALTATDVKITEFGGANKVHIFTVALESASDTIDLSSYFTTILFVIPILEGGADAALMAGIQASFSGTTVTLVSQAQDGTASTNWTSGTVRLAVIGQN